jgi:hypothetical protein
VVEIERIFECLRIMPMFAGVRNQIQRLVWETNKVLGKIGGKSVEIPDLPVMRMVKLWQEGGEV